MKWPINKHLPLFFILLPIVACIYLLQKNGIRFTFDSQQYACGATTLLSKGEMQMCDGTPFTIFPPGFPLLLSLLYKWQISYTLLSPVLLAISLACWITIGSDTLSSAFYRTIFSAGLCLATPLFHTSLFLWSEAPFICIISLAMLFVHMSHKNHKDVYLGGAFLLFSLSILFRYAGLFLLFPVALVWFLQSKDRIIQKKLVKYSLIPLATIALLIARNIFLQGFPFGNRGTLISSFWVSFADCSSAVAHWFFPSRLFNSPYLAMFVLWTGCIMLAIKWRQSISYFVPFLFYFFSIVIVVTQTIIEHDERLFAPIYPFLLLAIMQQMETLPKERFQVYATCTFLFLGYTILRFAKNIYLWC